ncbi:MAG: hypothetical protein CR986_03870 [Ignavibacteriae bacterium]|nr:MAG: hypothetical protein CR986_03870 [Ignavibacteriota bacterium]
MKKFKFISFTIFLIIFSTKTHSQDFDFHIGANMIAPFDIINFSPLGLRVSGDLVFDDFLLRTNLSFNYHSEFNNNKKFHGLVNGTFAQIEESFIYQTKDSFKNIYFGSGIGYYSVTINEQTSHPSEISTGIVVHNDNFKSNIGLNLMIGKTFDNVFIELKYIYSNFRLERYYYEVGVGEGDRYLDIPFHAINFSLVF